MKPLPTYYDGVTFRSRTEARWAVFFNKIGWEWKYEDQGFELDGGGSYLPDFSIKLPNMNEWWVEVKPDNFDKFDNDAYMDVLQRFTSQSGKDLILLDGNPDCKPFDIICHRFEENQLGIGLLQDYDPFIRWADKYWMQAITLNKLSGRWEIEQAKNERRCRVGRSITNRTEPSSHLLFNGNDCRIKFVWWNSIRSLNYIGVKTLGKGNMIGIENPKAQIPPSVSCSV
jgi:hypothetical protein